MAEVNNNGILIQDVETKNIMTKSTLPVGGYSVNPYVGCTHGCKYCYASFMKRFTGHTEPWGTFLDVKALAGNQKSPEIRRTACGHRLGDRMGTCPRRNSSKIPASCWSSFGKAAVRRF